MHFIEFEQVWMSLRRELGSSQGSSLFDPKWTFVHAFLRRTWAIHVAEIDRHVRSLIPGGIVDVDDSAASCGLWLIPIIQQLLAEAPPARSLAAACSAAGKPL
jgi:hypothetical protein